jgi:glyoxalase/bleomycin resistance protein/dioxygenase superfamily protein
MREQLDRLLTHYENGCMTRRELVGTLAALMMVPSVATAADPAIGPVKQLNHVTLFVQDVRKSVNFYQELFGMPILTPQPPGFNLKAGTGFVGTTRQRVGQPESITFVLRWMTLTQIAF